MDEVQVSSDDIRVARAYLAWSQDLLAKAAGVGVSTIADFEKGLRTPIPNNLEAIRRALEQAGVVFTPTGPTVFAEQGLYFMMKEDGASLRFRYRLDQAAALQDIIGVFGSAAEGHVDLQVNQLMTPDLRSALDGVVTRYGAELPQLNRLKQKLGRLKDGEYFLLLPVEPASTKDRLQLEQHLHALNHPGEEQPGISDFFGALTQHYDISNPRTDRRNLIDAGRPRACRFCGLTRENGATFKKAAHAMPTAFGNDHLKSASECDDCNAYFGEETEPSLIALLDLQRVFLGTQGRGKNEGRPKLTFSDGTMQNDGEKVVLQAKAISRDANDTIEIDLGKGTPIVPMAVYRALVKIVLSVVDQEQLPYLRKTIEWVRHALHVDQPLPLVARSTVNLPSNPSAQITVYTRKQPHPRLPHIIGEFRLGPFIFVFAVPFATEDHWDLVGFFDDESFGETFQHYMQAARWAQMDLSGTARVRPTSRLRFVKA